MRPKLTLMGPQICKWIREVRRHSGRRWPGNGALLRREDRRVVTGHGAGPRQRAGGTEDAPCGLWPLPGSEPQGGNPDSRLTAPREQPRDGPAKVGPARIHGAKRVSAVIMSLLPELSLVHPRVLAHLFPVDEDAL